MRALYMNTYGCPENFRESGVPDYYTLIATFPEIFNVLLFLLSLWMCVQNLQFVPLTVLEITGATQKFGQSMDTPKLPVLQKILWAFVRMDPVNVLAKFEVRT